MPGGSEGVTTLEVPVNELSDGRHMAFAVLTAPPAFFRGPGDESLQGRPITIEATFSPSGGGNEATDNDETWLVRPPVVMVHGLWSSPKAFKDLNDKLKDSGWYDTFLCRAYYDPSGSFSENAWAMPLHILNTLQEVRRWGSACTKVDIVGHSMGGLLAKRIEPNFAQKSVRKIITVGSPYEGSPLADWLWISLAEDPLRTFFLEGLIDDIFPPTTNSITGGAIADLRTINNTPTEIQGVDCQNLIVGLRDGTKTDLRLDAYVTVMCIVTRKLFPQWAHNIIFGPGIDSDWIVSEASQQGGPPNLLASPVAWHCSEMQDTDIIDRVLMALDTPAQIGQTSSTSPVPSEQFETLTPRNVFIDKSAYSSLAGSNGTVEIVSPSEGQICTAGQAITISVQGTGDTTHAAVFAFFGSDSYGEIVDLPWVEDVNVPWDSVGSAAQFFAYGLDPNMNITDQDEVNLIMDANVILEDILFGFGDEWTFDFKSYPEQSHEFQLYPLGIFSDGSEHPLSILSDEIVYQSYNEAVAIIDPNGLLAIHSRGNALITVTCLSETAYLMIEVDTYPGDFYLDGAVDLQDLAILVKQWLQAPGEHTADIAPWGGDGVINVFDFAEFAKYWLEGTTP
jgi:pimeloyl-ACP methyl ester carboxylesterase